MSNKLIAFIAAFGILFSSPAFAVLKNQAEIAEYLNKFMRMLQKSKNGEAADFLMKQWPSQDKAEVDALKTSIGDAEKFNIGKFGKPIGFETVKTCTVGKFLHKSQMVLKHEHGFVFWNFSFYNGTLGWTLDSYRFDNKNFVPMTSACT